MEGKRELRSLPSSSLVPFIAQPLARRTDVRNVNRAGAAVEAARHFDLLADKLLRFVLIVQLVAHIAGLQYILAAGLHYLSLKRRAVGLRRRRVLGRRRRTRLLGILLIRAGRLSVLRIRAWLLGAGLGGLILLGEAHGGERHR